MSRFGKIEWSDPRFERDKLRFLTFNSPALGARGDVCFFVPRGSNVSDQLPLVVLLHGVYCSHWAWAMKGGAHLTAARMITDGEIPPMVLAMPSDGLWGEGSGYLPHQSADYEAWIVDDVVDCAIEVVDSLGPGSDVFLAGLSMGGYGALRLGAKYADRFQGVSGHSSITQGDLIKDFVTRRPLDFKVQDPEELEVMYWMKRNRKSLPPVRFDCGLDDKLLACNRMLHKELLSNGIEHRYEEFPGAHKWPYWTEHLKDTLKFFGEITQT